MSCGAGYTTAYEKHLMNTYCWVAATTLACYEYTLTFESERNFLWKQRWNLASWLFLMNRYLLLGMLVIVSVPFDYQLSLIAIAAAFSALRAYAILGRSNLALALVLSLSLVPVITNAYAASFFSYCYMDHSVFAAGTRCAISSSLSDAADLRRDAQLALNVSLLSINRTLTLRNGNPVSTIAQVVQPIIISRFILDLRGAATTDSDQIPTIEPNTFPSFAIPSYSAPTSHGTDIQHTTIAARYGEQGGLQEFVDGFTLVDAGYTQDQVEPMQIAIARVSGTNEMMCHRTIVSFEASAHVFDIDVSVTPKCNNISFEIFLCVLNNLLLIVSAGMCSVNILKAISDFRLFSTLAAFSALRVFALLGRNCLAFVLVLTLGLVPAAVDLYTIRFSSFHYVDDPVLGSSCYTKIHLPTSVLLRDRFSVGLAGRICWLVSETAVLIVTWIKTFRHVQEAYRARLYAQCGEILLRDGARSSSLPDHGQLNCSSAKGSLYFASLLLLNAAELLIEQYPDFKYSDPIAAIYQAAQSILISRFLINLRLVNTRRDEELDSSRSSVLKFLVLSVDTVVGNMGEDLDYGRGITWNEAGGDGEEAGVFQDQIPDIHASAGTMISGEHEIEEVPRDAVV
ncbi:hypothetical protein NM688_g1944 [Phlebia brevispora]|uniref:Uncharacterized protein n=1 Tax=Phlebia brevispora TaxID=194682 RepID=A0ACC1T9W3_9APHY|nr:hypothetical protein NM688_g1944 [Phlebia brevispora]